MSISLHSYQSEIGFDSSDATPFDFDLGIGPFLMPFGNDDSDLTSEACAIDFQQTETESDAMCSNEDDGGGRITERRQITDGLGGISKDEKRLKREEALRKKAEEVCEKIWQALEIEPTLTLQGKGGFKERCQNTAKSGIRGETGLGTNTSVQAAFKHIQQCFYSINRLNYDEAQKAKIMAEGVGLYLKNGFLSYVPLKDRPFSKADEIRPHEDLVKCVHKCYKAEGKKACEIMWDYIQRQKRMEARVSFVGFLEWIKSKKSTEQPPSYLTTQRVAGKVFQELNKDAFKSTSVTFKDIETKAVELYNDKVGEHLECQRIFMREAAWKRKLSRQRQRELQRSDPITQQSLI